jgi:hypothetical protein
MWIEEIINGVKNALVEEITRAESFSVLSFIFYEYHHRGDNESPRCPQDIPDPLELAPDVPEALQKFIIKACAGEMSHRYRNVDEVIEDLKSLVDEEGIKKQEISQMNRKMATLFLLYNDNHQPELNRMMNDFCEKVNGLGVSCKAADFKEI